MESSPPAPEPMLSSNPDTNWRSWCRDHFVLLVGVMFFTGFAFVFMSHPDRGPWQECFVRAALRMQAGEAVHVVERHAYAYPPIMAMLAIPLANLPVTASMFGWYAVNVAAAVVVFVCAWRLAGGPTLVGLSATWGAIFWIGALLSVRFFLSPLECQQFDMIIAGLLFLGCYWIWRGHDFRGAALLGASAAMKCTPMLFAPYLVWRGKFRAACLLAAVAVGLNLLPDVLCPQSSGRIYLVDWTRSFLNVVATESPGTWFADLLQNQSLAGLFNRFWRFGLPLAVPDLQVGPLSPFGKLALQMLVYGTGLTLLAVTAWRFGKPFKAAPTVCRRAETPTSLDRLQTGIEASAVVCLMLLLSPMSSKSHYVVLLLPSLLIARLVVQQRNRWLRGLLVPLVIFGPLTAKGLLGKSLGDLTLAWGLPTWFALLTLVSMWIVLGAREREEEQAGDKKMVTPAPLTSRRPLETMPARRRMACRQ